MNSIIRLNWTEKVCPSACFSILAKEMSGYWKCKVNVKKNQPFLLYKCKNKSNYGIVGFGIFTRDGTHKLDSYEIDRFRLDVIEDAKNQKFAEIKLIELSIDPPLVDEKSLKDYFDELKKFATEGSTNINQKYQPQAHELFNRLLTESKYKNIEPQLKTVEKLLTTANIETEIIREVIQRVGQEKLRKELLELHHGMCQVSGEARQDLLVCSHIVPWSKDKENRLNPDNALLLAFNYDYLFDKGYITFDDDGYVIISEEVKGRFGIKESDRLRQKELTNATKQFLEYHRTHIFKK